MVVELADTSRFKNGISSNEKFLRKCPGGGTGRHAGLKILFAAMQVRVRFPPGAQVRADSKESVFLFMMYYTYILYSKSGDRYYIGFCADVPVRLKRHNAGYVTATKPYIPYELKAFKSFATQLEAMQEERRLKKRKSRKYLEFLIDGNW